MKKLEIEKTKPTFIISVLKVGIIKVGLVFSISNYFITKTPLANNWRRKKIPSCSYSVLWDVQKFCYGAQCRYLYWPYLAKTWHIWNALPKLLRGWLKCRACLWRLCLHLVQLNTQELQVDHSLLLNAMLSFHQWSFWQDFSAKRKIILVENGKCILR